MSPAEPINQTGVCFNLDCASRESASAVNVSGGIEMAERLAAWVYRRVRERLYPFRRPSWVKFLLDARGITQLGARRIDGASCKSHRQNLVSMGQLELVRSRTSCDV